jgi:hypothetical protein
MKLDDSEQELNKKTTHYGKGDSGAKKPFVLVNITLFKLFNFTLKVLKWSPSLATGTGRWVCSRLESQLLEHVGDVLHGLDVVLVERSL